MFRFLKIFFVKNQKNTAIFSKISYSILVLIFAALAAIRGVTEVNE